ncbi:MAG: hypothetical protein AAF153_03525, partial [Pseudomonadota bacterium]
MKALFKRLNRATVALRPDEEILQKNNENLLNFADINDSAALEELFDQELLNINHHDSKRCSALMIATFNGNVDVVNILLTMGVSRRIDLDLERHD